jgi:MFS transporter, ACS family, glucarate transporter
MPSEACPGRSASRIRYGVVGFGLALGVVTSIDRVVLSLSRSRIASDLHLTDAQMGVVFSAYATAYALCEMPSGHLGDRIGPRPVMMRIAIWWSCFMLITARAFSFLSLYVSQLFFGAGESGCYPNIARLFANWLPPSERVRAQGLVWLTSRWSGAATPILVAILFRYLTWRQTFATLSVIGVAWAVPFYRWFRSRDAALPTARISTPWGILARSRTLWLLCGQYLLLVFQWYFLITWAPTFIDEHLHPGHLEGTILKILPLFFGGLGALTTGLIEAPVVRWTGSLRRAHQIIGGIGFAGASVGLVLTALLREPIPAVLALAFSSFCNDLVMPVAWATATEVAGRWAGTVSGAMNMTGNLGGALYGLTAGLILQRTSRNWNAVLLMGAAVYLTGMLMWLAIDVTRKIEPVTSA